MKKTLIRILVTLGRIKLSRSSELVLRTLLPVILVGFLYVLAFIKERECTGCTHTAELADLMIRALSISLATLLLAVMVNEKNEDKK